MTDSCSWLQIRSLVRGSDVADSSLILMWRLISLLGVLLFEFFILSTFVLQPIHLLVVMRGNMFESDVTTMSSLSLV